MSEIITISFNLVTILNILLAVFSLYEWAYNFKANHSRFRVLYIFWIIVSLFTVFVYSMVAFNHPVLSINSALARVLMTTILSMSCVTAEVIRGMRMKGNHA
jgi:hypothetical protein